MRWWPVVALSMLLAGCAQPTAGVDDVTPPVPRLVTPPLLVLADGTYPFNEVSGTPGPYMALEVYDIVTQVAVSPCSYGGGAYFNNRQIPTATGTNQPVRNGTLRVTFDWADEDYPQPTLVLGYKAPGMGNVTDSPRVARGTTLELRIEPKPPVSEHSWQLFACLNRSDEDVGDPSWQPGPFLGSFTVHADFQGDPEPFVPEVVGGPRTSRSTQTAHPTAL